MDYVKSILTCARQRVLEKKLPYAFALLPKRVAGLPWEQG